MIFFYMLLLQMTQIQIFHTVIVTDGCVLFSQMSIAHFEPPTPFAVNVMHACGNNKEPKKMSQEALLYFQFDAREVM